MGIQDVKVPRPGVYRWEGVHRAPGAYMLVSPTGSHLGTWWPEAAPDDMHRRLTELAEQLNRDHDLGPRCPLCLGDSLYDSGGICSSCKAEQ